MKSRKVFISHASIDKPFVDRLVGDLTRRQIPVWYDRLDLAIGDSVPGSIDRGIADSRYFMVVLSPDALVSRWVGEELNAALMRQIAQEGTFLLPVLHRDCTLPPLLAHRRFADFRSDYDLGLSELLAVWGEGVPETLAPTSSALSPWPDVGQSDAVHLYLHSFRFDKVFRMSCSLEWSADKALDYIIETLALPWHREISELGMRWSFSYSLVHSGKTIPLSRGLAEAGVQLGDTISLAISGTYKDLYEGDEAAMWGDDKMYFITAEMLSRDAERRAAIERRGPITRARLKEIANSCFSHV